VPWGKDARGRRLGRPLRHLASRVWFSRAGLVRARVDRSLVVLAERPFSTGQAHESVALRARWSEFMRGLVSFGWTLVVIKRTICV
jgi:hypothetical protein